MDLAPYYTFIKNYGKKYRYRISQHDADDVLQHACLRALEQGDTVGGDNFFGYLKYSCLSFFCRTLKKRNKNTGFEAISDSLIYEQEGSESERLEQFDLIEQEIRNLPPADRSAIELEILGLSAPEAAVLLGTSPMAQWVSRSRGVKTLRTRLNRPA